MTEDVVQHEISLCSRMTWEPMSLTLTSAGGYHMAPSRLTLLGEILALQVETDYASQTLTPVND